MYRESVPAKQLGAWIAAALCPVGVQLGATVGWMKVVISGVICGIAAYLVWQKGRFGHWNAIAAYILLIVYMGQILIGAAAVWTGDSAPWVPLILLALALWSALQGGSAAARVGCVLFWMVLIIYPVVFAAALQDVTWEWALAAGDTSWELVMLLLIPALSKTLLKKKQPTKAGSILPICFVLAGALLTAGTKTEGFYELVKSIDLLGVVKHFEAVVCAGATVGWFSLLSISLSICGALGEGKLPMIMAALVMAAWMLCDVHIPYIILVIFGGLFWVLMPLLAQVIDDEKNLKKSEKTY